MNKNPPFTVVAIAVILGLGSITHVAIDGSAQAKGAPRRCIMNSERPIIRRGPAPHQLTSVLGILRRPSTAKDSLSDRMLAQVGLAAIWVDSIRLLASDRTMWRSFLVPGAIASNCAKRGRPEGLAISVVTVEGKGVVGVATYKLSAIGEGQTIQVRPAGANVNLISGIVPDGVTTVKVAAGEEPATIVNVSNNYFEADIRFSGHGRATRYEVKVDLLDKQGNIVRSIKKTIQTGSFTGSFTAWE